MPEASQQVVGGGKARLIGLTAALGGVGLLSAVQPWLHLEFVLGAAAVDGLDITGQKYSPALTLISLAALAAALVLMIAGKIFRKIVGLLLAVLGAGIASLGFAALLDPLQGAGGQITDATGISGDAQASLVAVADLTVWPTVTVIVGAALVVVSLFVLLLSGRWKVSGRKYDTGAPDGANVNRKKVEPEEDRISEWDALSDGDDPTT